MKNIDEIKKLNEELEIRDNLAESFRKEALNWANIANNYKKDRDMLEKALEEIKEIAENSHSAPCLEIGCDCEHCEDETTQNGEHCMEYGLEKIKQIISDCEGENE